MSTREHSGALTTRKPPPRLTPSAPISLRWGGPTPDLAFLGLFVLMALCHLVAALLARGWMTAAISDGIILCYLAGLLWSRPDWRPLTKFEQRGIAEGRPIADLIFRKAG